MTPRVVEITVNGQRRKVADNTTIAELLAQLQVRTDYVAVERNREIVPRCRCAQQVLSAGDELEIVTLVGGGCP